MIYNVSGTYAKLVPDNSTRDRIMEIIELINIPNAVSPHELHATVIYSRIVCNDLTPDHATPILPVLADGIGFEIFDCGNNEHCLVLKLNSVSMHALHSSIRDEHPATHDFPTYQPHVTLSYDYPYPDLPNHTLLSYFKNLTFDSFVVEPLDFMELK